MFIDNEEVMQQSADGIQDTAAYMENCIFDMASSLTDEERKSFMESQNFQDLINEGVIGKRTIVRLSKIDDLSRRIKLAVYQKAKEDGDPNYKKLKKILALRHALNSKLMQKYAPRGRRYAVKAQRNLIKINPRAFTAPIR